MSPLTTRIEPRPVEHHRIEPGNIVVILRAQDVLEPGDQYVNMIGELSFVPASSAGRMKGAAFPALTVLRIYEEDDILELAKAILLERKKA